MGLLTSVSGVVFMGLVLWGSVPFFVDAWVGDYYIGVEGMFTAPVWPVALVIVIAITVTMIQFSINFVGHYQPLVRRH